MKNPTIEYIMEPSHLFRVMGLCCNNVRWKASIQRFEIDRLRWAAVLRRQVLYGTFKTKGFVVFTLVERGKERRIQAVHVSERAVQKLFCEYALKPLVYPKLIYDNSASQKDKGTEFAISRLREHLRWHYARYGNKGAVLTADFTGYFDSIPHEGSIERLTADIIDFLIRKYVADFINAFEGDTGLGLGSEICQIAAVAYPNEIDKFIKEELHIHCYERYMDDFYIIHPDRQYVEYCLEQVDQKARALGLSLNREKTHIHNLANDNFTFLKKRVRLTGTGKIVMRLTRKNLKAERRRIRDMREEYEKGRMSVESIRESYQSWRSYAQKCNAYDVVGDMDKYFYKIMGDILNEKGNCA